MGTYPRVLVVLCSSSLAGEELRDSGDDDSLTKVEEGHPVSSGLEVVHSAVPLGWVVVMVVFPILGIRLHLVGVGPPSDTSSCCSVCICSFQMFLIIA